MVVTVDTGVIAGIVALFVTIIGLIQAMFQLWSRFKKLERLAEYRQEDTQLMLECIRALLEERRLQGANGTITTALDKLNHHLAERASGASLKR